MREGLPSLLREHAYEDLTGRGVTMAFLDAGFTRHPDLGDRILHYEDAVGEGTSLDDPPETASWHGTMTAVVGAGDGSLSGGRFRSLAPDAKVVLVRVATRNLVVGEDEVARGLEWVLEHHDRLGIRVVNVSVGAGDYGGPFASSRVDLLAEQAVERGLVVVAAAGNRGLSDDPETIPPANSPSVITTGGYADAEGNELYEETSFGITPDGLLKPEVLTPAAGVVAPLLTGTDTFRRAEAAVWLAQATPRRLREVVRRVQGLLDLPPEAEDWPEDALRDFAWDLIDREGLVDAHYKEVQGTSFAAPLLSSIVAQMLEANPAIGPRAVKQAVICAAQRLHGVSAVRQGFGRVDARRAVDLARAVGDHRESLHGPPLMHHGWLVFHFHGFGPRSVDVAVDADGWTRHPMHLCSGFFWSARVKVPGPGRYRYKFVVDGEWIEDPANLHVEPDGMGGVNSVVQVG